MQKMRKSAFLTARNSIEIRECPMPELHAGEVLLQMKAVGICGSDVSYYVNGRTGVGEIRFPHITGHECAGIVAAVGEGVEGLKVGDRVTTEPGYYCGRCEQCRAGRYNLCESMSFMGSAVADAYGEGALTQYTLRPAHLVFPLPDSISFAQAAMLEPLSVGLHAARSAALHFSSRAAILGCGPIGACIFSVLKALGVQSVLMTDMLPERISRMHAFGAEAIDVSGMDEAQLSQLASGMDAVFDTTCSEQALNASLKWLKKGGRLIQVGVPARPMRIDMQTLFNRGIALLPSFRYANTFPDLIALMEKQSLLAEELITHRFPFERVADAFALAASRSGDVMKVLVEFP